MQAQIELTDFIAAIDLGTSKIAGVIGKKNPDGSLHIYAIEHEPSDSCIKRGCIQNVDSATQKVKQLISKLENQARCKIGKLYVGIGGQSIYSIDNKVSKILSEESQITGDLIEELKAKSMGMNVGNKEIIDVIPFEYIIDGQKTTEPVGVYGSEIEASHKVIIGRPIIKKNILRMIEKIDVEIAGFYISPLASSQVLTEAEQNLGCILVDFGASTTSVSVYKDNLLRHLCVLPLGGDAITKDIASLQLLENEAEKVKIKFGSANPDIDENIETQIIKPTSNSVSDIPEIQLRTLHQIVLCRSEEIIENILNQIKLSGLDFSQLRSGFILTGGASALKGLPELIKRKSDLDIKFGVFQKKITFSKNNNISKELGFSVLLGLLANGTVNCHKEIIVPPKIEEKIIEAPKPPIPVASELEPAFIDESANTTKKSKIGSLFKAMFTDSDDRID